MWIEFEQRTFVNLLYLDNYISHYVVLHVTHLFIRRLSHA
jgi:hypothetical protein